jgi:hypothetical protein
LRPKLTALTVPSRRRSGVAWRRSENGYPRKDLDIGKLDLLVPHGDPDQQRH